MVNKSNIGITLIALIITVIVLVILSGIIIFNIFKQDGLIDKSKQATFAQSIRSLEENIKVQSYDSLLYNKPKEEVVKHKGKLTKADKDLIVKNVPTLNDTIYQVTGETVYDRDLYWYDIDSVDAKGSNYIFDMVTLQVYDYEGKYFLKKVWHTLDVGIPGGNNPGGGDNPGGDGGEIPDGYMRIHLTYPEESTDREWRIGRPGENRGDGDLVWQAYTGEAVLVKIEDIKNIWIRYKLKGVEVVDPPAGVVAIDIRANPTTPNVDKVTVDIYYDKDCKNQKYRVGNSGWLIYKGAFEVTENCIVEAIAEKEIEVKDGSGNVLGTTIINGKDKYEIKNIGKKEENKNLPAPVIKEVTENVGEVARVKIVYPEDQGEIKKVYKINSGAEIEYTSQIGIQEWGTEITAYYYKEDKISPKASKKFEDPTKLEVKIYVLPNPTLDEKVKEAIVEIDYTQDASEKTYKIDEGIEQTYTGEISVNKSCTITAYARKNSKEAKAVENIKFKTEEEEEEEGEIAAPKFKQEDNEYKTEAIVTIIYDAKAVTKQYKLNGGELREYTTPIKCVDGDVVYAINTDKDSNAKDATHTVTLKAEEMKAPIFTQTDNQDKTEAEITIKYDEKAVTKQYSINGGALIEYTTPIKCADGDVVYAIGTDKDLNTKDATHTVKLIAKEMVAPTFKQTDALDFSKTSIEIKYDEKSVVKQYSVNGGALQDYTVPFDALSGDVIYAVATDKDANVKDATYTVRLKEMSVPIISQKANADNTKAEITIKYDAQMSKIKKYSINGGALQDYTAPFDALDRDVVYAYSEDANTNVKDATFTVMLKEPDAPKIEAKVNEEYTKAIVKITYASNVVNKKYSVNDGELKDYTGEFEAVNGDKIYAVHTDILGGTKDATLIVEIKVPEMKAPVISPNYINNNESANISIRYDERAVKKQYSINGAELKDYVVPLEVTENNTVIYAYSEDAHGNIKDATYTVSGITKKLNVKINASPDGGVEVAKVLITIDFDDRATSKKYKINGGADIAYTVPFEVTKNCTIIAEAKAEGAYGKDEKQLTNLPSGIAAPIITSTKTKETAGDIANITIKYDPKSISNTYTINNGAVQKYTSPFQVKENDTVITAYSVDAFGNSETTTYVVKNLVRYLLVDKDKYYWIQLPYPQSALNKQYKYKSEGVWKAYREDGFILIKSEYEKELIQGGKPIRLEVEPGRYVDFDGHWYIFDGNVQSLQEDIYMKWDEDPNAITPKVPLQIMAMPTPPQTTDKVDIYVIYPSSAVEKQYKINGGAYQNYTKKLEITQNNTTVTAKAKYADGSWSQEVSYTITNIETAAPEGIVEIDANPKEWTNEDVEVTITYNPNNQSLKKKYKIGNGLWQYVTENTKTITVTANTAIYAALENTVGQSSDAVVYNVSNIDKVAPSGVMTNTVDSTGIGTTITFNLSDSLSGINLGKCKYKITTNGTPLSTNDSDWTDATTIGGENNIQDRTITVENQGVYYTHLLVEDNAGNRKVVSMYILMTDMKEPINGQIFVDSTGKLAPIPNGFVVSTLPSENTIDGGLVIKQGNDGASTTSNEFVWIPVPDITEMYDEATKRGKLYDFATNRVSTMRSDCLTTTTGRREPAYLTDTTNGDASSNNTVGITQVLLQNEFDAMIASVKKYKGFYIGRYETGDLSKSTVVVKKGNADIGSQTWYIMYSKSKAMISNSYVQTGIIWGSQWDATLRYMNRYADTVNYVTDSAGKGNYKNETFTYTDVDGSTKTKAVNTSTRIPTGSTDISKVKNIYDMAGNVLELTMEAYSSVGRNLRGGNYGITGSNGPASSRNYGYPNDSGVVYGSRSALYIK